MTIVELSVRVSAAKREVTASKNRYPAVGSSERSEREVDEYNHRCKHLISRFK